MHYIFTLLYNRSMKYVVLSGVSGGMGLATAKKLIESGYHVFGLDIKAPKEEIKELTYIKTDLRDLKSIEASYIEVSNKVKEIEAKKNALAKMTDKYIEKIEAETKQTITKAEALRRLLNDFYTVNQGNLTGDQFVEVMKAFINNVEN